MISAILDMARLAISHLYFIVLIRYNSGVCLVLFDTYTLRPTSIHNYRRWPAPGRRLYNVDDFSFLVMHYMVPAVAA